MNTNDAPAPEVHENVAVLIHCTAEKGFLLACSVMCSSKAVNHYHRLANVAPPSMVTTSGCGIQIQTVSAAVAVAAAAAAE